MNKYRLYLLIDGTGEIHINDNCKYSAHLNFLESVAKYVTSKNDYACYGITERCIDAVQTILIEMFGFELDNNT